MTAREKYRRITAYARACHRAHVAFLAAISNTGGFWNYRRGRNPELDAAREAEDRAWLRLPENVKLAVARP